MLWLVVVSSSSSTFDIQVNLETDLIIYAACGLIETVVRVLHYNKEHILYNSWSFNATCLNCTKTAVSSSLRGENVYSEYLSVSV